MKVLLTGDWHLDWITDGVERFDDLKAAALQVQAAAIAEKVDAFVFMGDLCNPGTSRSHRAVDLAASIARRLHEADIPSYWLVGNHDVVEDGNGTTTLDVMAQVPGATLMKVPGLYPGVLPIIALPFTPRSHDYSPADVVTPIAMPEAPAIVVGHLNIEGIAPGSEVEDFARGRSVLLPLVELATGQRLCKQPVAVVNGHYHGKDEYVADTAGGRVTVKLPGALGCMTHGEEQNRPCYTVLTVVKGKGKKPPTWQVRMYPLSFGTPLVTLRPAVDGLFMTDIAIGHVKGALVRVLPSAGCKQNADQIREVCIAAGARGVKVLPPASSAAVVHHEQQSKPERRSHRAVIDEMVGQAASSSDHTYLRCLCDLVMDEEGL